MIKYSIVLLAAAAVVFSVGCDSECCGVVDNNPEATNVAPVITRVLGATNNGTKTCTPGETVSLVADATDKNSNLDSSTYSWVEKVGSNENALGTTITCPADGASTKICATVKDKEGLESDEVCINLKGQAEEVATTCNPHITVTDPQNDNAETTTITKGLKYDFHNNVVATDCPNVQCTWSVRSHKIEDGSFFICLTDNSYTGTSDENPDFDVNGDGTIDANDHHVKLVGSGNTASINVQTCASLYDYFEVTLNCTNPNVNETKKYDLR